jgi:hypothetical protein
MALLGGAGKSVGRHFYLPDRPTAAQSPPRQPTPQQQQQSRPAAKTLGRRRCSALNMAMAREVYPNSPARGGCRHPGSRMQLSNVLTVAQLPKYIGPQPTPPAG